MTDTLQVNDTERHRQAIRGLERRLERDERGGLDTTIARLVLMRHYAAYAVATVRTNGGSAAELGTLTDRNNIVPLGWADGTCHPAD